MTPAWWPELFTAEYRAFAAAPGPVAAWPAAAAWLRRHRIDPAEVDARELAASVQDLELWVPTWTAALHPLSVWSWAPDGSMPMRGPGWLMDAAARQILAGQAGELWLAADPLDWLTLATTWSEASEVERGVVGLVRTLWGPELAHRVPDGSTVVVTEERLGAGVLRTVQGRPVSVRLWRPVRSARG